MMMAMMSEVQNYVDMESVFISINRGCYPLPDIFLDNAPHEAWAFDTCEFTLFAKIIGKALHSSLALMGIT